MATQAAYRKLVQAWTAHHAGRSKSPYAVADAMQHALDAGLSEAQINHAMDEAARATEGVRGRRYAASVNRRNHSGSSGHGLESAFNVDVSGHSLVVTPLYANGATFYSVAAPASISHTKIGQRIGAGQHYSIGAILKNGTVRVWSPAAGSRMFNKVTKKVYLDAVKRHLQAHGLVT